MKTFDAVTIILLIVGGLNWLLVGLFSFDLVASIFGEMTTLSRIIYSLVGLSAMYQAVQWKAMHRRWASEEVAPERRRAVA